MARTTARRSAASSPASPTVELTNTRSRWSGVRMTPPAPHPLAHRSSLVGPTAPSLERAGSTGNPAPPTPSVGDRWPRQIRGSLARGHLSNQISSEAITTMAW
jgi:hypothetical protein